MSRQALRSRLALVHGGGAGELASLPLEGRVPAGGWGSAGALRLRCEVLRPYSKTIAGPEAEAPAFSSCMRAQTLAAMSR